MLALATFLLALYNRKIVAASQKQLATAREDLLHSRRQSQTAREALETQTTPLLANLPRGLDRESVWFHAESGEPARFRDAAAIAVSHGAIGNEERVFISVPYRNVGNGVALVTSAELMIGGRLFPVSPRTPILPAGEASRAEIDAGMADLIFEYGLSLAVDGRDFAIIIGYADAAGKPRGAVRLDIHRDDPNGESWHVRQLHLGESSEAALSHPSLSSVPL
jgi:hypothetical protein